MKKIFISLVACVALFTSCIDKEAATTLTDQVFSCIQDEKWTLLNQIYPNSSQQQSFQNFRKYTIQEITPTKLYNAEVCVDILIEYIENLASPAIEKRIKLYLADNPQGDGYIVCDSEGFFLFDSNTEIYKYAIKTGCLKELEHISDVQICTQLNEAKIMQDYYFNKIMAELKEKVVIEKRWTEVYYAGQTHSEYAKITNNSQYDVQGLKYIFTRKTKGFPASSFGKENVPIKVLKANQGFSFKPYEYAVYNTVTTTMQLVIEDKVVWNIINSMEYTGNEYDQYKEELANNSTSSNETK